jgi:serine phosphatase RsbU (regulator of sigma subunit)
VPERVGIPVEFASQYEHERARALRRRALWYCVAVFAILTLSIGITVIDMFDPTVEQSPQGLALEAIGDVVLVLIHAVGVVLLARGPARRGWVVGVVSWMMVLSAATAIVQTQLIDNSAIIPGATTEGSDEAVLGRGIATLLAVFLLHVVASVLVTLSPREGLRALIPLLLLFAASVLIQSSASLDTRLLLVAVSPLAGLPGFLFSWWRHRSFSERFTARMIARRYAEVTSDLGDARRVHEALLPRPIEHGPIQLRYVYEPAREIGGDLLYARAVPTPDDHTEESPIARSVLVVVIDVTGHGVSAALAVNRLHGELERLCAAAGEATIPAARDVIASLNAYCIATLAAQRMYASAAALRFTRSTHGSVVDLDWANAGHPAMLIRRADGRIDALDATTCLLGVLPNDAFDAGGRSERLQVGDAVLAVTDGVLEARDARGVDLGSEGLAREVAGLAARQRDLARTLAARLVRRRHGPATDDSLIVEVAIEASDPSAHPHPEGGAA